MQEHITPEDVNAFVVVPLYSFVSDATRLDLPDTAYLARFHPSLFDEVLSAESDLHYYLKLFPPDYVLRVNEALEVGSFLGQKSKGFKADPYSLVKLFTKSIVIAAELLISMRLYGKGLLQRGHTWIVVTLADHEPPGQLSISFQPTGQRGAGWVGGEGAPYPVGEHELYRLEQKELPYFETFFRHVRDVLRREESQVRGRIGLALSYYNRAYGVESRAARLVDLMTCLESLLIDQEAELSYRLALRSANLLGADPEDRKRIYREIKEFYDTRAKLVHGGVLKERHQTQIDEVEKLREYVRRVLLRVMGLILAGDFGPQVYQEFDEMGLDDNLRKALQDKSARLLHLRSE